MLNKKRLAKLRKDAEKIRSWYIPSDLEDSFSGIETTHIVNMDPATTIELVDLVKRLRDQLYKHQMYPISSKKGIVYACIGCGEFAEDGCDEDNCPIFIELEEEK